MSKATALPKLPKLTDHAPYAKALARRNELAAAVKEREIELRSVEYQLRAIQAAHEAKRIGHAADVDPIEAAAVAILAGQPQTVGTGKAALLQRRNELEWELEVHRRALAINEQTEFSAARNAAKQAFIPNVWREHWHPAVRRVGLALIVFHRARVELEQLDDALIAAELKSGRFDHPFGFNHEGPITSPNSGIVGVIRELIRAEYLTSREPSLEGVPLK